MSEFSNSTDVPTLAPSRDDRAGPKVGERADLDVVVDLGVAEDGVGQLTALAD